MVIGELAWDETNSLLCPFVGASFFKNCAHPDEKQRLELGRRLGLESRQVKFWFQNRRTQMKVIQIA